MRQFMDGKQRKPDRQKKGGVVGSSEAVELPADLLAALAAPESTVVSVETGGQTYVLQQIR